MEGMWHYVLCLLGIGLQIHLQIDLTWLDSTETLFYRLKTHAFSQVTLIDFGFARALKEKDIINPSKEIHQENKRASFRNLDDSAKTESTNEDTNESSSRGRGSVSHGTHSRMSGTRHDIFNTM